MTKSDLVTLLSIILTLLSLLFGLFETKDQPNCINNISVNFGQVTIVYNVLK